MITATVRARVKPSIKELAASRAERLGLSLSTVMSIFVTKFAFEGNLPEIHAGDAPNAETLAAIAEAELISRDPNTKRYSNFAELLNEVLSDV